MQRGRFGHLGQLWCFDLFPVHSACDFGMSSLTSCFVTSSPNGSAHSLRASCAKHSVVQSPIGFIFASPVQMHGLHLDLNFHFHVGFQMSLLSNSLIHRCDFGLRPPPCQRRRFYTLNFQHFNCYSSLKFSFSIWISCAIAVENLIHNDFYSQTRSQSCQPREICRHPRISI